MPTEKKRTARLYVTERDMFSGSKDPDRVIFQETVESKPSDSAWPSLAIEIYAFRNAGWTAKCYGVCHIEFDDGTKATVRVDVEDKVEDEEGKVSRG